MDGNRQLVVVVDSEARANLDRLGWSYFPGGKEQKDETYSIETPLGKKIDVNGTVVTNPDLNYHTCEQLYLEITLHCTSRCRGCGVKNDIEHINLADAQPGRAAYITNSFVSALEGKLSGDYPLAVGMREMFYGGGEPLIDPYKFAEIHRAFGSIKNTERIVITNGHSIPVDSEEFKAYAKRIGWPTIYITYSGEHARNFALYAKEAAKYPGLIPANIAPADALQRKIQVIAAHCERIGVKFNVVVLSDPKNREDAEKDLRASIVEAAQEITIVPLERGGHRQPCSKAKELAIRANGKVYLHCYNVFNGRDRIGVVGLLVE